VNRYFPRTFGEPSPLAQAAANDFNIRTPFAWDSVESVTRPSNRALIAESPLIYTPPEVSVGSSAPVVAVPDSLEEDLERDATEAGPERAERAVQQLD
jgi:hypothetical protein